MDAKELVAAAAPDETLDAIDDVDGPAPPPMIPPFEAVAVPVCAAVLEDALLDAALSSNKNVGVNA